MVERNDVGSSRCGVVERKECDFNLIDLRLGRLPLRVVWRRLDVVIMGLERLAGLGPRRRLGFILGLRCGMWLVVRWVVVF